MRRIKFNLENVINKYELKQVDIAKATELSPVTINNFVRGTALPSLRSLIAMSEKLDVPIIDFFSEEITGNDSNKNTLKCPHCGKEIEVILNVPGTQK